MQDGNGGHRLSSQSPERKRQKHGEQGSDMPMGRAAKLPCTGATVQSPGGKSHETSPQHANGSAHAGKLISDKDVEPKRSDSIL